MCVCLEAALTTQEVPFVSCRSDLSAVAKGVGDFQTHPI